MARFYFMKNSSRIQMQGCVIITDKRNVIVIDGGNGADYEHLNEIIKNEGNGRVKAWFITHQHSDHTGAFCKLSAVDPQLEVENVYYNFPTIDDLFTYGGRSALGDRLKLETFALIEGRYSDGAHVINEREKLVIDDVTITVLRVYNPEIKCNFENNSSCVLRIEGKKSSVLILGDLGAVGGDDTLSKCTYEDLKTDYVQLAHHGQQAVKRDFYEFIRPERCLWATPDWLWDNDEGGGFNTGPYETIETRNLMDELGVKEHIITKDGTQSFEI
jgi:beta-lactamase superfamily II metal-dependent hydrolase